MKWFKDTGDGVSQARNKGMKQAEGEYIAFLDSDDISKKTRLRKQAEILDEKDVEMVFSDAYLKKDGEIKGVVGHDKKGVITDRESFIERNPAPHSTVMFKRNHDYMYHPSPKIYSDWLHHAKLMGNFKAYKQDKPMTVIRERDDSLTSDNFENTLTELRTLKMLDTRTKTFLKSLARILSKNLKKGRYEKV